ncbi:glycosyltransferase [Brevibacillus choshinensis]|uniref:Glycosyltransferase n=1 Tax=Brevibacillus choshinensis TaxID=54911 RepID=A0ABX7FI85_BRECH|nr:glycosyltransferase [Brevibacillus choshinensis]QRG65580.1 glycosyltransferase [Brevibacillus choshinensis]
MENVETERPELSVIIPASDEAVKIPHLINLVKKLSTSIEVIVVCTGDAPITSLLAHGSGARVIHVGSHFTYDEGRAIGGYHARGDELLFLDERLSVPLQVLRKYVKAIKQGWDVVITSDSCPCSQEKRTPEKLAFQLLNHLTGNADMRTGSMYKIPYALNRKAFEQVGYESLAVPPLAQVKAIVRNLSVKWIQPSCPLVWNQAPVQTMIKNTSRILADHMEAIALLTNGKGSRGGLLDGERYRNMLKVPGSLHLRSVYLQEPNEWEGEGEQIPSETDTNRQ